LPTDLLARLLLIWRAKVGPARARRARIDQNL
jgi:hypothetical protein